jgi:hypothetical protein
MVQEQPTLWLLGKNINEVSATWKQLACYGERVWSME